MVILEKPRKIQRSSGSKAGNKCNKELELKLEARFADVRRDMETMKSDLLKWVIGLFIAQVGLFAALVKLLH